jgi:hypothetical protein
MRRRERTVRFQQRAVISSMGQKIEWRGLYAEAVRALPETIGEFASCRCHRSARSCPAQQLRLLLGPRQDVILVVVAHRVIPFFQAQPRLRIDRAAQVADQRRASQP